MAKILVADDNSNIQKMVGLALKDEGIDVVAVGNGEAAVRKISDIRPDLVLADVFMPVRNGYEVCQYVKGDSALSHIPVILLVGAFDPLDEQEAQRVGADGVLKKPFVPPDPLISMVKSALARGGSPAPTPAPTPAAAEQQAAPHFPETASPEATVVSASTNVPEVSAYSKEAPAEEPAETEVFVEDVPAKPAELKIESGAMPAAFGSLLETQEAEEETSTYVSAGPERDWGANEKEEVEEEEEEEKSASWRRDGGDEALVDEGTGGGGNNVQDWRDTAIANEPVAGKSNYSGYVDAEETQDFVTEAVPEVKAVTSTEAQEKHEEPVTAPKERLKEAPEMAVAEIASAKAPESAPAPVEAPPVAAKKEGPAAGSWFSVAPNPWEVEAKKASQLASTWDTPAAPSANEAKEPVTAQVSTAKESAIPAATVEAIREEAAQVAESITQSGKSADKESAPASETDMDAMVAKVMSKMNPDVLQALTRELLKPMIETIVKDELKAKK